MKQSFISLLTPPQQGVEEQSRAIALLSVFLSWLKYIGIIFLFWYVIVERQVEIAYTLITMATVAIAFGLQFLLTRGYLRLVAWTISISLVVLVTLSVLSFGSVRDVGLTGYFLVLALVAVVLGERAILAFSGFIGLIVVGMSVAELNGLMHPDRTILVPFDPAMFIAVLAITTLLLQAAVREINLGFKRSREKAFQLDTLNADLEKRVRERTNQYNNANLQLQATKDRLEYLLSTNPAIIYSARAGGEIGTTYVSDNIETHLGYSAHEFLNEPGFWLSHIHPEDLSKIVPNFPKLQKHGSRTFEYRFRHKDGGYRWVRDEAKLVRGDENHPAEIIGSWIDITAQKNAEFALLENKHLLQSILDNTSTLIIAKDYRNSDGRYIFVNHAFAQKFGKTPAELKEVSVFDVYPEQVARRLNEGDLDVFKSGLATRSEEEVYINGEQHFLLSNKFPLYDAEGLAYGVCIVATDITERKKAEDELRRKQEAERQFSQKLANLLQGTNLLSQAESFDDLCRSAVLMSRNLLGFERTGIWLHDEVSEKIFGTFGTDEQGNLRDERGIEHVFKDGPAYEMIKERKLSGRILGLPLLNHVGEKVGEGEVAMAPLWDGNKAIGYINVDNLFTHQLFEESQLELLRLYAATLGHLLKRKQIEDELRRKQESEQQLSKSLTTLHDVINTLAQIELFDELCRMAVELGLSKLGFERMGIWFHGETIDTILGSFGTDEEGNVRDERGVRVELTGGPFWELIHEQKSISRKAGVPLLNQFGQHVGLGELVVAPLWDQDDLVGYLSIDNYFSLHPILDVTIEILRLYATTLGHLLNRKRVDDALRESQMQLGMALEAGKVGLWSWNFSTNEVYFSPEWKAQVGYTDDELPNVYEVWHQLIHPDDLPAVLTSMNAAHLPPWPAYRAEFRMRHKDGSYRWILSQGSLDVDDTGEPQKIHGSHIDITQNRHANEALRQSEARLALVFNNTSDLQILLEVEGNKIHKVAAVNQRVWDVTKAMGLEFPQSFLQGRDQLTMLAEKVYSSALLKAEFKHFREAITKKKQVMYEVEFVLPKGIFHGEVVLVPVLDEHDLCTHLLWSARDITERKRIEETLKLTNLTIDQIPDAVYWVDGQSNIVNVNFKASEMLRYTRPDLMNMTVADIDPAILPGKKSEYALVPHNMGKSIFESHHRTSDGQLIPVEIVVSDLEVGSQHLTCMLARDITLRKQAEQQLRLSLVEKEILLKEIHHRVKNNLQVISSLLYLQSQKIKDAAQLELFRESQNRVAAMALVHEQLYQSNNFAGVDFGTYVNTLVHTLFESYGVDETRITLQFVTDGTTLDINTAIPCGLMVSEIVSNALKYAFEDDQPGLISIIFQQENSMNHLWVKDNGVGMADGMSVRPGSLGLRLIEQLTTQIGGKLTRSGPPGTIYFIEFPA